MEQLLYARPVQGTGNRVVNKIEIVFAFCVWFCFVSFCFVFFIFRWSLPLSIVEKAGSASNWRRQRNGNLSKSTLEKSHTKYLSTAVITGLSTVTVTQTSLIEDSCSEFKK